MNFRVVKLRQRGKWHYFLVRQNSSLHLQFHVVALCAAHSSLSWLFLEELVLSVSTLVLLLLPRTQTLTLISPQPAAEALHRVQKKSSADASPVDYSEET